MKGGRSAETAPGENCVCFSDLGTSQPSRIAIRELVLSSDKGKGGDEGQLGRRSPKVVVSLKTASKKLSPQHADALFAAACLTAMYVFMCPPVVENIPRVPSWIPVLVGIMATGQRCWAWLQNGELAALMAAKADPRRYPTEDVKFPSSLLDLSRRGTLGELDPRELENHLVLRVYHDATKALEESWDLFWLTEPKVSTMPKSSCPSSTNSALGLVLLAYRCAMIVSVEEQYWRIKGRGVDEILRIEGVLDEKWKRWLDWAIAECEISKGF